MNKGRIIITGIILSIAYLLMESITHHYIFADIYQQTASIWRPEAEMGQLAWMMMLGNIIFAFMFGIIFAAGYSRGKAALGQGFRFGLLMALLFAPSAGLIWYVVLPIPGILAFGWFVSCFIQMWVLGIIAGLVYKP